MTYRIVEGYINPYGKDVPNIEKMINTKLEVGFKLQGGLIRIEENRFAQAMTYEKKGK